MTRGGKVAIVALTLAAVLVIAAYWYVASRDAQDGGEEPVVLPVVTIGQTVPDTLTEDMLAYPMPNGTVVWTVAIGSVDAKEPYGKYKATLIHDGQVQIGPETLKPGRLGRNGHLQLSFYEATPQGGCSHNPCDGNLSEGDYLQIVFFEPGEVYVVQILWGATGDVLVEVPVYT